MDDYEFENSIPEITFTPEISTFIKKNMKNKISKDEEKSIERMKAAIFYRAMSEKRPFFESKRGQTSIRNDFEYKKFKADFKNMKNSDKILENLINKYSPKKDCYFHYANKSMPLDEKSKFKDKLKRPSPIKTLNNVSISEKNQLGKSLIPKTKTKYSRDQQHSNMDEQSREKMAFIEIKTRSGIKSIKVRQGENLHRISHSIAVENRKFK